MPTPAVLLFLFSVFAGASLIAFSFRLKLRHPAPYLDLYFYLMVATASYGFVNWVGPALHVYFSELTPQRSSASIVLFVAGAIPLVLAKLYLFVRLLFAILRQDFPSPLARIFPPVCVLVLIATGYLIAKDYRTESYDHLGRFMLLLGILVIVADYLAVGYFLSRTDRVADERRRRHARNFGWAYLVGYFVYASPFYVSIWIALPWYQDFAPYLYYLMHLPPMLFLRRFSEVEVADHPPERDPAGLIGEFGISRREGEVLELLLAGNNNRQIAEQLFISPNTVRNHISSIYGKTSVKNRIQLFSLCDRRFQRGETH